jgi:DNA-binding response OmpR family regulator
VDVRRALVVDDDPDINRLVAVRLRRRNLEVATAGDGEEALAALAAPAHERAEIVFTDIAMPRMDGLALLERIRADGLDCAVVMMTAFGSETVAIDALRRGADDYLRKPLNQEEFVAVLERTLTRIELRRKADELARTLEEERRERDRLEAVLLTARTFEHEVGNKLATTVGYAELLSRDKSLSDTARSRAAEVLRGAQESVEIMRRVLELDSLRETRWGALGQTTLDVGSLGSGRSGARA